MVDSQTGITTLESLVGGALVDMGNEGKTSNYGIGINSSDNSVNLPARAISLFETQINSGQNVKVEYDYKGILGTLPTLEVGKASGLYDNNMVGTQGIYTDNMYIGSDKEYIAFYTDKSDNKKKLKISVQDLVVGYDENDNEISLDQEISNIASETGGNALVTNVFSTYGQQTNGSVPSGIISANVIYNGVEIDKINKDIKYGFTARDRNHLFPSPVAGDQFILFSRDDTVASGWGIYKMGTAWEYNGTRWNNITTDFTKATYTWTIRDGNNEIIASETPNLNTKCIYVDGSLIEGKITFEVKVEYP